jgi:hypothetical protein
MAKASPFFETKSFNEVQVVFCVSKLYPVFERLSVASGNTLFEVSGA